MSEKRVAPPDGGSGDLVLIQRHLENLSAGEILEELDARMEEMTDQSCDPELIRLYLDVLEEKEPLGLELDPEASLQRFLEERAGEESRSTPPVAQYRAVSIDRGEMDRLADRCNRGQLDPLQLEDVILDAIL